jgi:hypothetical protein
MSSVLTVLLVLLIIAAAIGIAWAVLSSERFRIRAGDDPE